ncbi:MAG: BamA/TamA family outer membrane protein [Planctomycetes bacterium]|nr:BamA/TamA family outer membrane protein [Planctomycetota bacterium]
MRGLWAATAFLVLTSLAGAQEPASPPPPVPGAGKKVVKVQFEGNRRYTQEFLREQVASKEGEAYDPGLIGRDSQVLRQYFAAVADTIVKEVEGGVEITFVVLDKSVVGQVVLQGLARVREDDIRPLLTTRPGRPLLEHALEADRQLIERLHRQKGYYFVDVHCYRRQAKKADTEDIVFQVIPKSRVKVRQVIYEGNNSFEPDQLSRFLQNSDHYRRTWLGLGAVFGGRYYDRQAVEQDRRKIEVYYEREGFLDVRVVYVGTSFDEDREEAILRYRVEEGARYRVNSFQVEFAPDSLPDPEDRAYLSPASLETLSLLEFQQPFRLADLSSTERQIRNRLWERAYAKSSVEVKNTRDPEHHTVDVKFVLRAGPKVRLGRNRIYGNTYTKDNVIRRQFRQGALPGEPLDIEELQAAQTRLLQLRYFSVVRYGDGLNPWGLVQDPASTEPDVWDTEVEVAEDDTRSFNFGAGVSTDGGAYAQVSVTWRNFDIKKLPSSPFGVFDQEAFRGGGQTFSISAAPGTTYSNYGISFANPAMWDSRWSFDTSIFRNVAFYDTYRETTDGGYLRVGRFLDPLYVWRISFEYGLSWVTISDPDFDAPQNALDIQGRTTESGIKLTLRRAKRREADAFLNGHITTVSGSLFGAFLGGEVDVVKAQLEHRAGWRAFPTKSGGWHRVMAVVSVDWAEAFDETDEVPIFERYFLGGRNLRGFEFRGVGPRSNGSPQGGEFMVTWSTQYTIPLTSREASGFSLDLVFFVDQGNLVVDPADFSFDEWRLSVGFGFAIGFGGPNQPPLLLDFGFAILDQDGDEKQVVSVAFERNF